MPEHGQILASRILSRGGRAKPTHRTCPAGTGNGPTFPLCNSRDASGPALLLIQADIGGVVRGVKAGEFDLPDLTDELT